MAEGNEGDVMEDVVDATNFEDIEVFAGDYDESNGAALWGVIDRVVNKMSERDHLTLLVFPLLWDFKEILGIPNLKFTSVFVTFGREIDRRAGSALSPNKESLCVSLDVERTAEKTLFVPEVEAIDISSEASTSIQDLPNEILDHVFSYLDIKQRILIELVCKRWRMIVKELPWRNATKLYFIHCPRTASLAVSKNESVKALQSVLSRCGWCLQEILLSLKDINSHKNGIPSKLVSIIVQCCPNLVGIELSFKLTNASLKILAKGCPNLKRMNVRCFGYNYNAGMLYIVKYCRALECLSVADLPRSGKWFDVINPKLQCLRLTGCLLSPVALKNLINRCDALEELTLSFCKPISQSMLFEVCDHFKQTLKMLRLRCGSGMEDINWCSGLKNLHNLTELCVAGSWSVDDDTMNVIAKTCFNLRGLCIARTCVGDIGLVNLRALPCLKVVDNSMNSILGFGLVRLAERGLLEKIYLDTMVSIHEVSCCALATNCPNFRVLDLTGVMTITNNLVETFCGSKKRGYLRFPVELRLGQTAVTEDVKTCNGIDVTFENQPRPWVANLS